MVPSYFEHHLAKNPFLKFYLLQSSVSYWNKNKVQPSAESVEGATINSRRKNQGLSMESNELSIRSQPKTCTHCLCFKICPYSTPWFVL